MDDRQTIPESESVATDVIPAEETASPWERIRETGDRLRDQITPRVEQLKQQLAPRMDQIKHQMAPGMNRFSQGWRRFKQWRDQQSFWQRLAAVKHWRLIFVVIFLVAFLAPVLTLGATALVQYSQLKSWGLDGVNQLTSLKDLPAFASLFGGSTSGKTTSSTTSKKSTSGSTTTATAQKISDILSPATLSTVRQHCTAAQSDFTHINTVIANRDGIIGLAMSTSYGPKILAVQQLAIVGIDATVLCNELASVAGEFSNSFKTSPFSSSGGPILTQQSFADVQQGLQDAQVLLTDIQAHVQHVNLNDLPVSATERAQVAKYLPEIPKALRDINTIQPYIPLAGWALGVDSTRHYLIQTMDRSELRPTGGFNGQWGVLSIDGGRIGAISLADVTFVDFTSSNGIVLPQSPPVPYRSWWFVSDWGMRDADLSGDFPTSAKLIMNTFIKEETASGSLHNTDVLGPKGSTLDGDIHFSPLVIEHLLDPKILGPMTIPCYNVTVNSTNLEDVLHYYQNTSAGQAAQNKCASSTQTGTTSLRKRFTQAVAFELENLVRSATQAQLLKVFGSLRDDLQRKELEVYVTNTPIESLLAKDHLDASIVTDPKVDATTIIQTNISVNKGSTFVTDTTNEYITLDAQGGAYHDLVVQLNYAPTASVNGELTYRDYIRVYVPPDATYYGGSGFDQNIKPMYTYTPSPMAQKPLCKAPPKTTPTPQPTATGTVTPTPTMTPTSTPTPFPCTPAEAPTCQSTYNPTGSTAEWIANTEGSNSTFIDDIGEPTNFVSDMPGRNMYGGLVVIPAFCVATVELRWYVPSIAGTTAKHNLPYSFTFQRQSGTFPNYNLQIAPAAGTGIQLLKASLKNMTQDATWTLALPAKGKYLNDVPGLGLISVALHSTNVLLHTPRWQSLSKP